MARNKGRKHVAKKKNAAAIAAATAATTTPDDEYKNAPHTFVFHRGKIGKNVKDLLRDVRRVMEPFTASKLKVRKKNVLKDFVSIAGMLHVSHFVIFTKTEETTNLRVCRLPRGPTLTFQVESYSLDRDIVSSIKRPNMEQRQFHHHPLLVMNGFSGEGLHFKLMATMFQNMFPPINVHKVKLSNMRRCLMLNYNAEDQTIDFRHYNVKAIPMGMSRGVKKLIKAKVPNLGKFKDVSDFLTGGADLSESEAELDGPHNEVILPQDLSSRGNMKAAKSAIRLTEIGPRMTLKLIKIEEGVCTGEVLHHSFIQKTPAELELMKQMRAEKKKLKEQRRQEQEKNIKKKEEEKQEQKKKSLAGMKKEEDDGATGSDAPEEEEDDDISYYKQEVGEDPEPELFPQRKKFMKRKGQDQSQAPFKKRQKIDAVKKPSRQPLKDARRNKPQSKQHGSKLGGKRDSGFKGKQRESKGKGQDFKGKGKFAGKGGRGGKGQPRDRKAGGKKGKRK